MPTKLLLPPPQPKQELFLNDHHKYVIFGGSRGGGKSFALDLKGILACEKYSGFKYTILRRTFPELKDNHIEPLKRILRVGEKDALARYNASDKNMVFPNGSVIRFRFCDNENALRKIQGQETDMLGVDEATNIPEEWLKKLYACIRGTNGYPKRIYLTCNPGGVSHGYIYRLMQGKFLEGEKPEEYSFIQSTVFDNKKLLEANPDYVSQLEALPPKLRDAWLYGRWDVFEGAYFEEFRDRPDIEMCEKAGISQDQALKEHRWTHVIKPFDIPKDWKIYRSYDWGYGKPFSCGWWAQDYEGVLYRILELYGCTKTPNEGVKWSNKQQFDKIAEIEREHPWLKGKRIQGVADPSIWDGSHGISAAEEAEKHQLWFEPGVNDRIPGWMQVHERMKFDENGYAMLYFFDTCKAAIRTMPLMMYDEHKVEDLDTSLEDHACLVGDTQVLTDKGYAPIASLVGQEGMVMSSDGKFHHFHDCMLTKANADVYEVELEDGTKIVGTADHPVMLEDGTWCALGELVGKDVKTMEVVVIGDKHQRFNGEDFYLCGNYYQHKGKRLHRAVWEFHNGPIPPGYHVHHIDENRNNNSIENLELLEAKEHLSHHSQEEKNKARAREVIKKARKAASIWHGSEEGLKYHSELGKENWKKRTVQTYTCSCCGKKFQTKHIYGANQNHFCHPNCKARFRTARLRHEREACKALG